MKRSFVLPVKKFTMLAIVLLVGACSSNETSISAKPTDSDSSGKDGDLALQEIRIPTVSAINLDNSEFRVSGVRASLQDFMTGETPVLNYLLPENADFVEVVRCKSDTIIRGPTHDLADVDLGSPSLEEEKRIFKQNNFWDIAISQTNQCVLVSNGFSAKIFRDLHVPSGSYRYLVRACVSPERLTETEYTTNRHCSRQIGISTLLQNFINKRADAETEALQRVSDMRDKVDGIGREIYYLTVSLNNALSVCNEKETQRQVRVMRKEAFSKILGIGISLGLELALPSNGVAAVMSGTMTFGQLWNQTWDNRDVIAGQGMQVAQALNWLFSAPEDFPRTCTAAKELAMKADIKSDELKNASLLLAEAADEALVARKNRTQFVEGL